MHRQIFDLIYYGNGGFNWSDVYEMPIWLRTFYIKSIEKALRDKAEAEKKASKKSNASMKKPNFRKPRR